MKQPKWLPGGLAMALAALLAACGGGGGGGSDGDGASAVTYNVQAAFRNLSTAARSFTLRATAANGTPLTLDWTITPVGASVFPLTGAASQRVDTSVVIRSPTLEFVNGSQQSHFDAMMNGLGSVRADGSCSQGDNPALPTAAAIGASGPLGDSVVYRTCSLSAEVVNRITGAWSFRPELGVAYLCADTQLKDASGATTLSTESDCIEISPDGTIGSRARITLSVPSVQSGVLVFAN